MRVLVACEFSGIVREAFKARGHDAWSCDLLDTEIPGQHIKADVRELSGEGWDLMIAHPPCTYLTIAGAAYYRDAERTKKREQAIEFFQELQNFPIARIAIENPIPFKSVMSKVGRYHQRVNPFEFGECARKAICLWLKGLPPLLATNIVNVEPVGYCVRKSGPRAGKKYNYYHHQGKNSHARSRFFRGIADAMATQWA